MKIIQFNKKPKHLTALVFLGGEVLIDDEVLILSGFKIGDDISESQLEALKYKSEFTRAKSKALWLLDRRDYSKKELLNKLKPDFDKDAANEAVEFLCESGIVDDRRFAENYASYLIEFKSLSQRAIKLELAKKGIDRGLADEILEALEIDSKQAIKELIKRKYSACFGNEKEMRRMYGALVRKGYSYDDIRTAINEYTEEEL